MKQIQRTVLSAALCTGSVLLSGCAKVEPGADFRRAAQLIGERAGSAAVYDPQAEAIVEERVDQLLADGLTIEEAVQVALLNNRAFQAAFQEIGISRADLVQAGLLSNPSFVMMFRLPEGGGRPNSEFGIAQQLVDLWQIPVRKEVARAQLEATILDVAQRAVTLAFDVRGRAIELLALQRTEEVLHENLRLVERSMELARHQYEAGAVRQLDVNLARGNVNDVHLELIALRRERQVAEATLARLLNLSDTGKPWYLRDELPSPPLTTDEPERLVAWALEQRLDAQVAQARVREAESDLRREYLNIFPNVEVGLEVEVSERRALPGRKILADTARESIANGALTAPGIESRAQRARARREIIDAMLGPSLALTIPIFDQNQAQIAKARYRAIQRRKEFENLLNQIINEVEQAAEVAGTLQAMVRFYQEQALPQGQAGVEGAQQLYEAGQQTIAVLIEAQESLIERRRAYVRAQGEYAIAIAELERALGGRMRPPPATQPTTQPVAAQSMSPENVGPRS